MSTSSISICNMALHHVGSSKRIASLTEASQEASICRSFYADTVKSVLSEFPWSFAKTITTLGLVKENPNSEWLYSYRLPNNCIKAIRILSGIRNDTKQSRVKFVTAYDESGPLIYTDKENAELEYIYNVENESLFPIDFAIALSFRIAAYIAPSIATGDPFKLADRAIQFYEYHIAMAKKNSIMANEPDEMPESEFIRARE